MWWPGWPRIEGRERKLAMNAINSESRPSESKSAVTRRNMLLGAGAALHGLAAALIAIPVLGYILSGFTKPKYVKQWIPLGKRAKFPEGTTRPAKYRNPFTRPRDGEL